MGNYQMRNLEAIPYELHLVAILFLNFFLWFFDKRFIFMVFSNIGVVLSHSKLRPVDKTFFSFYLQVDSTFTVLVIIR